MRVIRLAAWQLVALFVAARVSVALHELAGHALPALALGLGVEEVSVSWFGGGFVRFGAPVPPGAAAFIVEMGGILLNLVLFLGAASLTRRWRSNALAVFAAVNVFGATHYAVLGSFHGFGDPAGWPQVWPPALGLAVIAVPVALAQWLRTLPLSGRSRWLAVPVAALALAGYGAGYVAEQAWTAGESEVRALKAESAAVERAVAEERERRRRAWAETHGGEEAPPEIVAVSAEDVPRPFPMTAALILFDGVALVAVVFRGARR
ncbi:MAG: hypothetical protein AMXMBFR64_57820 [Myxococcales bacterium]